MLELSPALSVVVRRAALLIAALAPIRASAAPEAPAASETPPEGPDPAPAPGPAAPSEVPEAEAQPIRWWDPDTPIRAQWSRKEPVDRPVRPTYLAEDEFSAARLGSDRGPAPEPDAPSKAPEVETKPIRWWDSEVPIRDQWSRQEPVRWTPVRPNLGFRGVTVGLAAQMVFGRFPPCAYGEEPCTKTESPIVTEATPTIDLLAEFGGRRLRLVLGVYSSPVFMGFSDAFWAIVFGARAGFLVGNEKIRGGVTAGGGYLGFEVNGHLFVTPWRDRRGGRHGVALGVGAWLVWPSVTIGYRFAPAALNHRGGRMAAIQRARAQADARSTAR